MRFNGSCLWLACPRAALKAREKQYCPCGSLGFLGGSFPHNPRVGAPTGHCPLESPLLKVLVRERGASRAVTALVSGVSSSGQDRKLPSSCQKEATLVSWRQSLQKVPSPQLCCALHPDSQDLDLVQVHVEANHPSSQLIHRFLLYKTDFSWKLQG